MANEVIYKTKAACQDAIDTLKSIGMDPLPWQLKQLKAFEDAEVAKENALKGDTPIWSTLQMNYPYGVMPQKKIDCVESTVAQLLEDGPHAEEPGLLLGKIQCGKTDTFEDIIGLAFDKGIDIAVVLTKGTKALVNQTKKRSLWDYRFFKESDDLDQRATIRVYDIMDIWRTLKQATVESGKTVIICKKNSVNLDHLIEMFNKRPYLLNKKVLIVDDEADFASRNYRSVKLEALKDENGNPLEQEREMDLAKISQQIDIFRKVPGYCRYLQVTATPYCLYLQPQGELNLNGNIVKPFRPRFTSLVPIHDRYIGGDEYYVKSKDENSMYHHLFHMVEQKCIDVLGHEHKSYLNNPVSSGNVYGLTYALVAYLEATAVRRIQVKESQNKDYKTSAVIHVEIDKKNHKWQKKLVDRLLESIRKAVVENDTDDKRVWTAIDGVYNDFEESNRKGREEGLINISLPSKESVLNEIRNILETKNCYVQIVNADEQMESILDPDTGELNLETAATIFIGGNILDRGVTIQHMLCFFYGRNPGNFQQDTVLQHARMYGARSKEDMAVTRLHTTSLIYGILVRMNELDNQLRDWFIKGNNTNESNAVFVGFDKNIKPCATQKIKASKAITLKPQQRILPVGFWTGSKKATEETMAKIDRLITESPNYGNQDENGFFEIDKDRVVEILNLIASTYVYDANKHFNIDHKNDMKELLCAFEYCNEHSDGTVYVLHRTNRDAKRVRENGGWTDAPDDGHKDTEPSHKKAIDRPVMMFFRQNGARQITEDGSNIGWNDAPFYWPLLMTPKNVGTVMYALDQSRKDKVGVADLSEFYEGINPQDVLSMSYAGDLEEHFGAEGTEYEVEDAECETRVIKETTASKYLLRDEKGELLHNSKVPFDEENDHGVYSANNGIFPFVLRPYKYMLLRNRRDLKADVMLLELFPPEQWEVFEEPEFNEDGDLIDRDTKKLLVRRTDKILSKSMDETDFKDDTITQWVIMFKVKRVLKLKKSFVDWSEESEQDE